jgi:hypothetical protein
LNALDRDMLVHRVVPDEEFMPETAAMAHRIVEGAPAVAPVWRSGNQRSAATEELLIRRH